MPQPFTVRSRKLSQLLRLDRSVFMNVVQSFQEDGQRIVDNLLQVKWHLRSHVKLPIKKIHGYRGNWILVSIGSEGETWNVKVLSWLQRLRESDDPRFEELSSDIEALLADGGEMSISLCSVAAGGNVVVMEQLLKGGADPNKADYSGRTPLVWCNWTHRHKLLTYLYCLELSVTAVNLPYIGGILKFIAVWMEWWAAHSIHKGPPRVCEAALGAQGRC